MCGIFGMDLKEGFSEGRRAILAQKLAELNDKRGGHSWGYARLDGGLVIEHGLHTMSGKAHKLIGARTFLGHTRYATHGARTVENAHPFQIGKIVGAHNGVLYNHSELCKKYNRNFEVDSQHLFAHLDAGLSFEEIEGYGAIEWRLEHYPERIYLVKLKGGSLSIRGIGEHETVQGVVWSSLDENLKHALNVSGFNTHFDYTVKTGHVYYTQGGKLFESNRKLELSSKATSYSSGYTYSYNGYTYMGGSYGDKGGADSAGRFRDSWEEDTGEKKAETPAKGSVGQGVILGSPNGYIQYKCWKCKGAFWSNLAVVQNCVFSKCLAAREYLTTLDERSGGQPPKDSEKKESETKELSLREIRDAMKSDKESHWSDKKSFSEKFGQAGCLRRKVTSMVMERRKKAGEGMQGLCREVEHWVDKILDLQGEEKANKVLEMGTD